jgi:hypothetical protein
VGEAVDNIIFTCWIMACTYQRIWLDEWHYKGHIPPPDSAQVKAKN